jgi:lyso-ornithine lipid O-acyltransferase
MRSAEAEHVKRVWIQPLSAVYTAMLGLPLGRQSRCHVSWYGGMSLLPHLRQLVARGAIDVVVSWGDPVAYDAFSDRKAVARLIEENVRAMTGRGVAGQGADAR